MKPFLSVGTKNLVTGLGFWVVAFLLYLPTLHYGFIHYDDVRILADHPELYDHQSVGAALHAIMTLLPREEPLLLRDATWALDSRLFGFHNTSGFHFTNILLHACVVMLCFCALLQVTRRYALAVVATIGFASLAVHVEPVAWIMGRKDLLVALFGFLALLTHSRGVDETTWVRRLVWYGCSLCAVTLALFSKISAISYPGLLCLVSVFQPALRRNGKDSSGFLWARVPHALLSVMPHLLVSIMVFLWYRGVLTTFGLLDRGYTASPLQHLENLLVLNPLTWLTDLQLLLVPRELTLFHFWPGSVETFGLPHIVGATVAWITIVTMSVITLVKRRELAFYLFAFFALMVPYMNLQFFGIWVANRYLYFTSFCVFGALATLLLDLWKRGPRALGVIASILYAGIVTNNLYCQRTAIPTWQNAEAMFDHEVKRPDAAPDVYYSLASSCYTTAIQATEPAVREAQLQKTEEVVAQAMRRFPIVGETSSTPLQNLLLLNADVAIVRGESGDRQLEALSAAEHAGPQNDAILWQLMKCYYTEALKTQDDKRRTELAKLALSYFERYRACTFHEADSVAKDRGVRAEFLADFPFLGPDLANLP